MRGTIPGPTEPSAVRQRPSALDGLAILFALSLVAAAPTGRLGAQRSDSTGAGRNGASQPATVADLEARIRHLDSAVAKIAQQGGSRPEVRIGAQGLTVQSAERRFGLTMRGYFQSDGRTAIGSDASSFQRGMVLRRVRPIWIATLGTVAEVRLMPDFGGASPTIYDAHLDLHFTPALNVRSGKFKPPIGLERLMSATDIAFIERAHPTNIAPNRDVGIQLYGDVNALRVSYAFGVFNGVPDIGFAESDPDRFKDLAGRIAIEPLRGHEKAFPGEIILAIAASNGEHRGTTANPQLQTYRSPLQESFFRFRSDGTAAGTTVADGRHERLAPQVFVASGPVGVMGEYTTTKQGIRRGTDYVTLRNHATNLTATWLLTGERASYRGVTPSRPFDPLKHQYGAFELAGRFSTLAVDRDAFPIFADTAAQARDARTAGAAFNWYLGRGVRVMLDYTVTRYRSAGSNALPWERALSSRFQFSF